MSRRQTGPIYRDADRSRCRTTVAIIHLVGKGIAAYKAGVRRVGPRLTQHRQCARGRTAFDAERQCRIGNIHIVNQSRKIDREGYSFGRRTAIRLRCRRGVHPVDRHFNSRRGANPKAVGHRECKEIQRIIRKARPLIPVTRIRTVGKGAGVRIYVHSAICSRRRYCERHRQILNIASG